MEGWTCGHPTAAAKQQMNMGWTSLLLEEKRLLLQKAEHLPYTWELFGAFSPSQKHCKSSC